MELRNKDVLIKNITEIKRMGNMNIEKQKLTKLETNRGYGLVLHTRKRNLISS